MSDPATYRKRSDVEDIKKQRDPIEGVKKSLVDLYGVSKSDIESAEDEISQVVARAAEFALSSEYPDAHDLIHDVLATDC
jgi:pyruvate dehydrogenase E1 component alpha subunit